MLKNLFDQTARALTGSPSAAALREALLAARQRLEEVDSRLSEIEVEGRVRNKVLVEGTIDDVAALNAECDALRAEAEALRKRVSELHARHAEAAAREGVKSAKQLHKALDDACEQIAAKKRELAQAEQQLRAAHAEIMNLLVRCRQARVPYAPLCLDSGLIARLSAHMQPQDIAQLKRELSQPQARPARQPEAAKGELVAGN